MIVDIDLTETSYVVSGGKNWLNSVVGVVGGSITFYGVIVMSEGMGVHFASYSTHQYLDGIMIVGHGSSEEVWKGLFFIVSGGLIGLVFPSM